MENKRFLITLGVIITLGVVLWLLALSNFNWFWEEVWSVIKIIIGIFLIGLFFKYGDRILLAVGLVIVCLAIATLIRSARGLDTNLWPEPSSSLATPQVEAVLETEPEPEPERTFCTQADQEVVFMEVGDILPASSRPVQIWFGGRYYTSQMTGTEQSYMFAYPAKIYIWEEDCHGKVFFTLSPGPTPTVFPEHYPLITFVDLGLLTVVDSPDPTGAQK